MSGARGDHLLPGPLRGVLAGEPEDVRAAGELDQLRRPVTGGERRVEPLERGDARPAGVSDGQPDAVDARCGVAHELDRGVLGVGRLGERARIAEHLADGVRVERDHARMALDLVRDGADVVVGDRAHRAQRLGDDQVRPEFVEQLRVELVDRFAGQRPLLDGRVDLRGREPARQHVPRDPRQLQRRGRVVALVGHGDKVGTQAEREQHLGG